MNDLTFIVVLVALIAVHLGLAAAVLFKISGKIEELRKAPNNKYVSQKLKELESQKLYVLLVPIIGPILGYGLTNGFKTGIPERGYMSNSPGKPDVSSEGD